MTAPIRQSLTVIVGVRDAAACAVELGRRTPVLEAGWRGIPQLSTACLALLPALAAGMGSSSALLLECGFEGELSDLLSELWRCLGPEIASVLAHCDGYASGHDPAAFAAFLRARARRASALFAEPAQPSAGLGPYRVVWQRARAAFLAAQLAWPRPRSRSAPLAADELERRRAAVGWQESEPGVPLVHVAELGPMPGARSRVKRALRALDFEASSSLPSARLLLHGDRIVLLAYPPDGAAQFSERVSQNRLAELARVWQNAPDFRDCGGLLRRARRARRVERFLLERRVPVAAWFNAA